jgi:hypothetical protein
MEITRCVTVMVLIIVALDPVRKVDYSILGGTDHQVRFSSVIYYRSTTSCVRMCA